MSEAARAPLFLGIGFSNVRSFDQDLALLAPLSKVTLIAGRNNSGKSNVLAYLEQELNGHLGEIFSDNMPMAHAHHSSRVFF